MHFFAFPDKLKTVKKKEMRRLSKKNYGQGISNRLITSANIVEYLMFISDIEI